VNTDFNHAQPIYTQIMERLKAAIANGVYAAGQKMPAVRELAVQCRVNPNTMQRALAKLEDEGFLYSERTAGRFVTRDAAKIAELQDALPAKLTAQYIADMKAAGVAAEELPAYVMGYIVRTTRPERITKEAKEELL